MRAGDAVKHIPSGEKWTLAYGDVESGDGTVSANGWPESTAAATDCEIFRHASDDESSIRLHEWATREFLDRRHVICKRYLQRLGLLPPDPVTDFEIAQVVRKAVAEAPDKPTSARDISVSIALDPICARLRRETKGGADSP
jgi:hypothetical protein